MRGSPSRRGQVDRLLGEREPARGIARVVQLERQPREQARPQRGVLVAEAFERLLQHGHALVVDPAEDRPLAREAERRPAEQRGIAEPPGEHGGLLGGAAGLAFHAGPLLGGPEVEQHPGPYRVVGGARELARPQRRPVVLGGLLPGQQPVGPAGGGQRVLDRAFRLLDGSRLREVVGELRQPRVDVRAAQRLDRLAHPAVQPGTAQLGQTVVERGPHERVREGVAAHPPGLAQHARLDALLERRDEHVVVERGDRLQQVELELAADHGRHLERLAGRGAQAPQPPRRHLAHAVRHPGLGQRSGGMEPAAAGSQVAHDLLDEERVALGLAVQRPQERRLHVVHPERGHQLGHLGLREPGERDAGQRALAPDAGGELEQRVVGLELGVTVGAEQQHAPRMRRPYELAQQLEGRPVGPVQVVEHEHERGVRARLAEQRGDRLEEPHPAAVGVTARVLIRRRPELREEDPQLGRVRPEPLAQRLQRGAGGPPAHHLDDRLVRGERVLVEAPVEHDRAVLAGAARHLGRQPRLADPGVAGEEHEPAAAGHRVAPGVGEHAELGRPAHEPVPVERRGERSRPRGDHHLLRVGRARRAGGLAPQQPLVHGHRGGARRGAELVAQEHPQVLERPQGLGGVAGRFVDLHQQPVGRLAERRGGDRGPRRLLGSPELAAAAAQPRLGERLEGAQPHRLELTPLLGDPGSLAVGEEGQEVDPERAAGALRRACPVASVDRRLGPIGVGRGSLNVDLQRLRRHEPQLGSPDQGAVAERPAELGEQRAERGLGRGGRLLRPQDVDQLRTPAIAIAVEHEIGEQETSLPTRQRHHRGVRAHAHRQRTAKPYGPRHRPSRYRAAKVSPRFRQPHSPTIS